MSQVITVIAVLTDPAKAVFIDITGKRHTVAQTDPALAKLIRDIMPLLLADQKEAQRTGKPQKGVKIDLGTYSMYTEFTEKTGGLVKFFRAVKSKVQSIVDYVTGADDTSAEEDTIAYRMQQEERAKALEATLAQGIEAELVKDAEPVLAPVTPMVPQRPRYEDVKEHLQPIVNDSPLPVDETLVAVIGNVVIPGIEALKPYIQHALKNNSEKAVTAFLERIARAIDTKGHTIPDLMKFIQNGDLPLADDGSIIAYKVLKRTSDHGKYTYVDCHSRRVHQRVGTYVRIPEKMVDPDRRNDCSHGLHVARRGYLGGFSGDVCVLIKMAPEDVVAVPEYDANKVRACGYHIIAELSKHVYDVLRSGRGMAGDPEAAAMLQKAISGEHIGVLEEVWINGPKGTKLEVKNELDKGEAKKAIKADAKAQVEVTNNASNLDPEKLEVKANPIDPRELNKQIKEEEAKQEASKKTLIQIEYDEAIAKSNAILAQKVLDTKKRVKKSWEKLGLPADAGDKLQAIVAPKDEIRNAVASHVTPDKDDPIVARNAKAEPKKTVPLTEARKKTQAYNRKVAKETKASVEPRGKEKPIKTGPVSNSEHAQALFIENKWAELWAFKKAKKKGWETFGFSASEIAEIEKHKP